MIVAWNGRVHPMAECFCLIEGVEFDRLVDDIRTNGQVHPITLDHEGTLLDGRNRVRACEKARVEPVFAVLPEDADAERYILSANVNRRHESSGQRAIAAANVERYFAERTPKGRPPSVDRERRTPGQRALDAAENRQPVAYFAPDDRKSAARAGALFDVSRESVRQAKRLREMAPDLHAEVAAGKLDLKPAYKQAQRREKTKPTAEPKPRPAPDVLTLRTHDGTPVPYPRPKSKPTFNLTNDFISWADWSWNPVTGCLHGCNYCYARELALREGYRESYPVGFTPLFHEERLDAPANSRVPPGSEGTPAGRVFVCSMADLYGKWVPGEWIHRVHAACADNPQWEYLFLTKFPSRYVGMDVPKTAWLGTSVDTQRRVPLAERAFGQIEGARVRWLSLEPLLEPLRFDDLSVFDWVVIGAQSATVQPKDIAPNQLVPAFAPPFEWVSRIVDQAHEAGCGVYLKPNLLGKTGPQEPGMTLPQEGPRKHPITRNGEAS